MFSVSAIICSHNPRPEYLRRVLDALEKQTLPKSDWELLLVDNASSEPISARFDLSWHPNARHLREDRIGKTHAILLGIRQSKGGLLVIVDDDNILREDYFENCLKIADEYPQLGAWGGSFVPEYEAEPPPELRPWLPALVTDTISTPLWAKMPVGGPALPYGAGMAVRRKLALHYQEQVSRDPLRQAIDRTGKKLGCGGDSDLALSGFALGFGAGRFPQLQLTHIIPARRLTLPYIEGLFEGVGYGSIILMAVHDTQGWWQVRYPHLSRKNRLKPVLFGIFMLITGKSKVERRIKIAEERGRQAALCELERLGDFRNLLRP